MSSENSERFVLLNHLADEFAERYRRGERPSLQEYIDRHPELADDIREFFPALVEMEQVKEERQEVSEPTSSGPLPPLERLGDFRILREIGHGGMGVVYEAEQVSLGRRVALKVLPRQLLVDARAKQRFEREAKAAARLHHTNIVPVFGVGEHEGLPFYVMQFIPGLGLDEVLEELKKIQSGGGGSGNTARLSGELRVSRRDVSAADVARSLMTGKFAFAGSEGAGLPGSGPDVTIDQGAGAERAGVPAPSGGRLSDSFSLSSSSAVLPGVGSGSASGKRPATYWQSVARIGVQVADALEHAHRQGIQHRDIKPSNLLLDTQGTVWVTDFGLAKADDQQDLTHTGDILGTLRYMPPEAFDGRSDARGDVYSLGLTLYELLALRPAFDEKERNRLIKQVTTAEPARLRKLNREVPRDLETIVHKAIERDPAHRYPSAEEFLADLQRFLDDEPIKARRQTALERYRRWARRNPGIAVLGAVLTAVLVLATVASLVVAGRMTALAQSEAQAAEDERAAKKAADESRAEAMKALEKAEENYARARAAVNEYLTAVSDDERLKAPGLGRLRAELLQSALGFYQEFLKERGKDPALRRELAAVYFKVGTIYSDLGQAQPAGQSYAQAQRLYEVLAARNPDDPEVQHGLAQCLNRRGQTDRAIAIWEKLVRPGDPRYLYELGWAYNSMAITYGAPQGSVKKKDPAKELEFLRKALDVRAQLVTLRPDDPEARQGLAASLNNIAVNLPSPGREADKLPLLRRAAEEMEVAYKLRPDDPFTSRLAVIGFRNLATSAAKLGYTDEAVAAYRKMVQVLERRARDLPEHPGVATDLVNGYYQLIGYLRQQGRLDEAARLVRESRERMAELTADEAGFFRVLPNFHLEARAVAQARGMDSPGAREEVEREEAAAVAALRNYVLTGYRDVAWLQTSSLVRPLRGRADFRELLAHVSALVEAERTAKDTQALPAEKVPARQECLVALEALAATDPGTRQARRAVAGAHQNLGQALLDAGQIEEARAALGEARAVRRQLVEEAPTNKPLRAELAESEAAAGDLFAAAGRLADAVATWDRALATLEDGLRADPNSIPFRTALAVQSLQVADRYGRVGLWDRAAKHYRRAFEAQTPTQFQYWYYRATVLQELGDTTGLRSLTDQVAARLGADEGVDLLQLGRIVLLQPDAATRYPEAFERAAQGINYEEHDWPAWCRGLAAVRRGQAAKGIPLLEKVRDPLQKFPALALALHQEGQKEAAQEALRQADALTDQRLREALAADHPAIPNSWWSDWLLFRSLRREAHRLIHGKALPDSPYERLFRGRVLAALGEAGRAEAEFEAAVALRPDDSDVWLSRARIFAKLGEKERMAADLDRAKRLDASDPRPWVEAGRLLAEMGDPGGAEEAFARASAVGKGSLNPFLEAGWWAVGPYPEEIGLACPPEVSADPSKPVVAVGGVGELRWQSVPVGAPYGALELRGVSAKAGKATFYALAYVYADGDRTASLKLRTTSDLRVWVNGQLVLDGFAAWNLRGTADQFVPVALEAGMNRVLVKTRTNNSWCECQFHDAPSLRALELMRLGLWSEASDLWAEADRRGPLNPWYALHRVRCLQAAGREDEARGVFAEALVRHGQDRNPREVAHLAMACFLPPETTPERERWVGAQEKIAREHPQSHQEQFRLGHVHFRAGQFEQAEESLRRSMALGGGLYTQPLLAMTLHHRGRAEEARKVLRAAEGRHAELVKQALAADPYRTPLDWREEVLFRAYLAEARMLIDGRDPGPSADEIALLAKGRDRWAEREKGDEFVRLTDQHPDQPRLWIDRGRRLGGLGRWEEGRQAFARAAELGPKDAQVRKERGRAHAELGKWDEAAADLARALERTPEPKGRYPYYPWQAGRGGIEDLIAGWDEVFERVAKLRPKDATLWARRVEHFAARGRWAEAEAALKEMTERYPEDWWAPNLLGKLLLLRGGVEEHGRISREALDRFAGSSDYYVSPNLGRMALLAPSGLQDHAVLGKLLATADQQTRPEYWAQVGAALTEYRRGDAQSAYRRLSTRVRPNPNFPNTRAFAGAVEALALQKFGRTEEARSALAGARALVDRHRPRPERGWRYDWDWHNWLQVEILAREAEQLLPAAPKEAAAGRLTAQEHAARRERKSRADRAGTALVLALLRLELGQKEEAEAELRQVLADRARIAGEEPTNEEYRADVAATQVHIGRLLMEGGRFDEGKKEIEQAVAALAGLDPASQQRVRIRQEMAAAYLASGKAARQADQPAEAVGSLRKAAELIESLRKEQPEMGNLAHQAAEAEWLLGELYGGYGLLGEAARVMRVDDWPAEVNLWRQIRAGQLHHLDGDPDSLRKVASRALETQGDSTNAWTLAAVSVANGVAPDSTKEPERLLEIAKKSAEGAREDDGRWVQVGTWEYRAGRYEEAVGRLDVPGRGGTRWGRPVLAMAHHRLGNDEQAREWLGRARAELAGHFRGRATGREFGFDSGWETLLDALCLTREAHELITGEPLPADPMERLCRARAYAAVGEPGKADAELQAAGEAGADDPGLWLARSRLLADLGRAKEAEADRSKALSLAEKALAERPADTAAAETLASLLLDGEPGWAVLRPLAVKSEGGATLTVQPDGSVLAGGANPDRDVYIVEAEVRGPVGAIRLEALPDAGMPKGGSGRADSGNFILTDVRLTAGKQEVKWSRASADFSQGSSQRTPDSPRQSHHIATAIDADPSTGWAIYPKWAEPHWANFIPEHPVGGKGRTRLTLRLAFQNKEWAGCTLGRFRLSVAARADIAEQVDWVLAANTPHARLGAVYLKQDDPARAAEVLGKATEANPKCPPADWLVLALAYGRLGEKDKAKQACGKAAALFGPAGADPAVLPLVRETYLVLGGHTPEAAQLLAAAAGEPPATLAEAVREHPDQAKGYLDRGRWYASRGLWKKAADDLAEANRLQPSAFTAMTLAFVLAELGEWDRYREHCRATLARWEGATSHLAADQLLKLCLIRPDSGVKPGQLDRLARLADSGDEKKAYLEWFLFAKGLHAYRSGDDAGALAACRKSREHPLTDPGYKEALAASNLSVEAMALHRQGDGAAARQALAEAKRELDGGFPVLDGGQFWHDVLAASLLYREAEALVEGKKEAPEK